MTDKVHIYSFLWGDWCAPYGANYVNKLYRGVARNTTVPYDFTCFWDGLQSDGEFNEGIIVRPLATPTWKGKLPKISAFNPELSPEGQVFIFDLDTVVVGNLDELLSYRGDFCARAWFKGVAKNQWVLDGDLVSFKAGAMTDKIWNPFIENVVAAELSTEGRERYWYRQQLEGVDMWQRLYPEQLISYKNHVRGKAYLPENARLVSCHGNPRPHEIEENWIKSYWI